MSETTALALNIQALTTQAGQLKVAMEIDHDKLREALHPYTHDFAALQLAAKQLVVNDEKSNQICIELLNLAFDKQKGFESIWARFKDPLNKARKVVLDLEKKTAGAAEDTKTLLSSKSAAYLRACQIAKQETERKLSRLANTERARLEREAEEAMMDGNVDEAQFKLAESQMIIAPTLPDLPVTTGARITPKYRATVHDVTAVLKAIVEGRVPLMHEVRGEQRALAVIDQVVLNALVSRLGPGLKIPGVVIEEDVQVAADRRSA